MVPFCAFWPPCATIPKLGTFTSPLNRKEAFVAHVGRMNAHVQIADHAPSTVLLVEDDDGLRGVLAVCLRIAGYRVETASDERGALEQFSRGTPAAVVTDLILPQGEGMNAVKAMRNAAPEVPIVVMSGGGMFSANHLLGIASSLGAVAAISKPFKPAALVDVVRNLVAA